MRASPSQKSPGPGSAASGSHHDVATYRIFDTPIESQIPLPELPACPGAITSVSIRWQADGQIDTRGFIDCHEWRDTDRRLLCNVARRQADYLMSLPGHASFLVAAAGTIYCAVAPGGDAGTVRQLLLSQVLPRYLAHTGEFLVHASAVTLQNGKTVAFVGDTGQGKSTLAAYCQQQAARIIDDDCVLLRCNAQRVAIVGGVPTLRLYPDSLQALGHDPEHFAPDTRHSPKRQMPIAKQSTPAQEPRALDALFLLDSVPPSAASNAPYIERVGGQNAVMALLRSVFSLDPSDTATRKRNFSAAAQVLNRELPVYRLHYPREHNRLPQVLQCVSGVCSE